MYKYGGDVGKLNEKKFFKSDAMASFFSLLSFSLHFYFSILQLIKTESSLDARNIVIKTIAKKKVIYKTSRESCTLYSLARSEFGFQQQQQKKSTENVAPVKLPTVLSQSAATATATTTPAHMIDCMP